METKLPGSQEFRNACSVLNKYNLSDLWKVSSILSCVDNFDTSIHGYCVFFPMLNFDKIAMFNKAILNSSARDYKTKNFNSEKLPEILNSLSKVGEAEELDDENEDPETKILNFISKKANAQFQFQNVDFGIKLLRAYALYEHMPNTFDNYLRNKHKGNYVNIPKTFKDNYNISIKNYLIFGLTLFGYYSYQSNEYLTPNKTIVDKIKILNKDENASIDYKSKLLFSLVDQNTKMRDNFCFDINELFIKNVKSPGIKDILTPLSM